MKANGREKNFISIDFTIIPQTHQQIVPSFNPNIGPPDGDVYFNCREKIR